jgi:hypothetical protein
MKRNQFSASSSLRPINCTIYCAEADRWNNATLIGEFDPRGIEAKRLEMGTSFDLGFDIFSKKAVHELIELAEKGRNIIIYYGESDSSVGYGVLAAFREFFFRDGIEIFRDYNCSPDKFYFNLVYECLIRYDTRKGTSGPDKDDGIL